MGETSIQWTEETWNPVRGCTVVDTECANCYAAAVATRFSGPGLAYEGLARRSSRRSLPQWTGDVRFVPEKLAEPLHWRRPRVVFANSMSDLFHDGFSFEQIAAVFGVMASASSSAFQVLTKRPERARDFFHWIGPESGARYRVGMHARLLLGAEEAHRVDPRHGPWPLPNVGLGVSVGRHESAVVRVPLLLELPAAWRFVSYEPALGPVAFAPWMIELPRKAPRLDWIIVGGESCDERERARPFDVGWARSVIGEGAAYQVPVFVKQLGARPYYRTPIAPLAPSDDRLDLNLRDDHGGDWREWPEDLRVRQYPPACDKLQRALERAAGGSVLL